MWRYFFCSILNFDFSYPLFPILILVSLDVYVFACIKLVLNYYVEGILNLSYYSVL